MINIDTLDNVIAVVVVILLLSLIVQSIQSVIKKALKIKSKQLEDSLLDLFDVAMRGRSEEQQRKTSYMPTAFSPSVHAVASEPAKQLLNAVREQMRHLGRVSSTGNFMIDSLSKSDLLNVVARVAPDTIVPDFLNKLKETLTHVRTIEEKIKAAEASGLPGEAHALFAKFQASLSPLRQHYQALISGDDIDRKAVVADVLSLRHIVFDDSLELLTQAQKVVAEQKAPESVAKALTEVTAAITAGRQALDRTFGEFRKKHEAMEKWFDTTMQGFEERYHRGMRTWSLLIAGLVVVYLNANPISLYRSVATNEVLRASLVSSSTDVQKAAQRLAAAEAAEAQKETSTVGEVQEAKEELERVVGMYTSYGFKPITLKGAGEWFDGVRYTNVGKGTWWGRRGDDVRTLFGWVLMTLLLSLGAPFWNDTLESLFGVKNLLRRRTEGQNVEQRTGAGNPKP